MRSRGSRGRVPHTELQKKKVLCVCVYPHLPAHLPPPTHRAQSHVGLVRQHHARLCISQLLLLLQNLDLEPLQLPLRVRGVRRLPQGRLELSDLLPQLLTGELRGCQQGYGESEGGQETGKGERGGIYGKLEGQGGAEGMIHSTLCSRTSACDFSSLSLVIMRLATSSCRSFAVRSWRVVVSLSRKSTSLSSDFSSFWRRAWQGAAQQAGAAE
jgi:hypothetical protein